MNKHKLKEYIKSRIRETLYAGAGAITKAKADPDYARLKNKPEVDATLRAGGSVELEEMARKAATFKVSEDFKEKAKDIKTGGPISPKKLADILAFLDGKNTTTGPEIAAGVGFEGQMPRIYPVFAALINAGALIPTDQEKTVDVPDTPENEDVEGLMYSDVYDKETAEPEEDEFEKEPEEKDIKKISTTTLDPITQKSTEFTIDNSDLITAVIRAYKDSRVRLGALREEEGNLSAADYKKALKQSKESGLDRLERKIEELINKIKELEPEVQDKVLNSLDFKFKSVDAANLSKVLSKKLGKNIIPAKPINIPDEEIEDTDDEEIMEDSGVEDVDYGGSSFKDYDSVYERIQKLVNYKK
jgi:hypothetical protein